MAALTHTISIKISPQPEEHSYKVTVRGSPLNETIQNHVRSWLSRLNLVPYNPLIQWIQITGPIADSSSSESELMDIIEPIIRKCNELFKSCTSYLEGSITREALEGLRRTTITSVGGWPQHFVLDLAPLRHIGFCDRPITPRYVYSEEWESHHQKWEKGFPKRHPGWKALPSPPPSPEPKRKRNDEPDNEGPDSHQEYLS